MILSALSRVQWLAEGHPTGTPSDATRPITALHYMQHAHMLLSNTAYELTYVEALDAYPLERELTLRIRTKDPSNDAVVALALDQRWDRKSLPVGFQLHIEPDLARSL